ncbi:PH domain-containing protein [Pseudomonas trivialis]|uniref:PH domain-containing protein n=3 Tax=Pseudomonas fluorescens group TaxID=136843 RepID=A0ABY0TYE8_9PSED|nr:PH domain-containing protein [Pseudomonas trivialis]
MVERTNPARQIQIHKQNAIHQHPFETPPTQNRQMIDFNNKGFFKLKQNNEYAERVSALLLDGEEVVDAYKAMRDGVVFTTQRIIAVNVQGITGSKKDFTSLPYKNIVAYSVETSGTFDLDSELEIYFSSLGKVKFEFTGKTSIVEISRLISRHLLG